MKNHNMQRLRYNHKTHSIDPHKEGGLVSFKLAVNRIKRRDEEIQKLRDIIEGMQDLARGILKAYL